MQTLSQIISQMVKEKRLDIREPNPMSWGDHEQCHRGFVTIFCEVDTTFDNYQHLPETNLDYLLKTPFPIIDELGVESLVNDYGEKSEGFNLIMNAAERYHRPIFATTNLTKKELLERYGERTLDRLGHLCRIVEFKGESLR